MVLEGVCPPALLYLAFSIIQIIIDLYRGDSLQALFKFVVMIVFTIVLNAICAAGMSIISWFIVFIPFILMTYITTILFFVFGFNPGKVMNREKKCGETQFGCCDDGMTTKHDPSGRGCPFNPVEWNNKDATRIFSLANHSSWALKTSEKFIIWSPIKVIGCKGLPNFAIKLFNSKTKN
jgi:hypothetical protein